MHISQLDTPSVLVDLDILERNLDQMAAYCAKTDTNMHDTIYGVRGENVETVWTVSARGRVQ